MSQKTILWTSLEAAVITGGQSTQEWQAMGICLNANEVMPGDLFFSAQNDDLEKVFRRGAVAAVVPWNVTEFHDRPLLRVRDVFTALQELAKAARFKTQADVIAVQGAEARKNICSMLKKFYDVHHGGRHLSQGLAALPEVADFAVFGFSPQSRPDIAIVTDCTHVDGSIFEAMKPSGRVLICSDKGDVAGVIARARASGIRNIFTFGQAQDADAMIQNILPASEGGHAKIKIFDEVIYTKIEAEPAIILALLATSLILKISGASLEQIRDILSGRDRAFIENTGNITLFDRIVMNNAQTAFRVVNMIDTGQGRRTAVLDNISAHYGHGLSMADKNITIPSRIDNLHLVFACSRIHLLSNAETAIRESQPSRPLGRIVPEVLSPGDFLTFRGIVSGSKKMIANALRNISPVMQKQAKADHAL